MGDGRGGGTLRSGGVGGGGMHRRCGRGEGGDSVEEGCLEGVCVPERVDLTTGGLAGLWGMVKGHAWGAIRGGRFFPIAREDSKMGSRQ